MNADSKEAASGQHVIDQMVAGGIMLADTCKSNCLDHRSPLIHNSSNYWTSGGDWVIMVD